MRGERPLRGRFPPTWAHVLVERDVHGHDPSRVCSLSLTLRCGTGPRFCRPPPIWTCGRHRIYQRLLLNALSITNHLVYDELTNGSLAQHIRTREDVIHASSPRPSSPPLAPPQPPTTVPSSTPLPSATPIYLEDEGVPSDLLPYLEQGRAAMGELKVLFGLRQWREYSKKDDSIVRYVDHPKYKRRIFLTEAVMPIEPRELLRVFWEEGDKMEDWNPTVEDAALFKDIGTHGKVTYQLAAAQSKLVTQRDFVNINYWEKDTNGTYYLVYMATEWPEMPPTSNFTRGENGPSGFKISPLEEDPSKSRILWVFNTEFHFFLLPDAVVNAFLPPSMHSYMFYLRKHVRENILSRQ
ncbi:unnamed protein product [Darwinula stevensoni]|uniref:START domain-containing protein n=1 Tax=Darwinula stevensoni TaxID=69355 RepID=A0A7R9AC39_9CRUS|nr:unnamed protein product [Darwinula stevensoni]CAG0899843.1 unnamed protein product [Darwinula stevensoni]